MIEALMLTILAFGFFVLTFDMMEDSYVRIKIRVKEWVKSIKEAEFRPNDKISEKAGDKAWEHLRRLLALTMGIGSDKGVRMFAVFSAGLSALVMVLLSGKISTRLLILSMFICLALPYGILRSRLETLRIRSSREGEVLITEILNNYRINYFNMREAIEKSALTIEEAPNSRRLLLNLSRGINRAGNPDEIRHFTEEFRLSLNTSWGNILSDAIYIALVNGTKVDDAIADLSVTILKARKIDEFSRRENNETRLILRYLVPIAYILTVLGGVSFFGLTISKFIDYQFRTEAGLTWFTISSALYVAAILANRLISKTKLDF